MNSLRLHLLLILTLLLGGAYLAQAQDTYVVLNVQGTIKHANGKPVVRGDRLSPNEKLAFVGDAAASLVHPQKGRFVVKGKATAGSASEVSLIVGQNVVAARPAQRLSSRDAGLNNQTDVAHYVAGTQDGTVAKRLLFGVWAFEVSPASFPLNENRFFFVRYTYRNEPINKKLPYTGSVVRIDPAAFYQVDGKPIDAREVRDCMLYYLKGQEQLAIGAFEPVFATEEQQEEVRLILESLRASRKSAPEIYGEIYAYLAEMYGTPAHSNLKNFLKTAYGFDVQ